MTTRRTRLEVIREDRPELTPVQYAILGLLHEHPAHGYELQRSFSPAGALVEVAQVEQPTLYANLKDLAARNLIAGSEAREGARPPRTVYALTEEGTRLLDTWLREPVQRLRQVRLDFLLKVYFARRRSDELVAALVDAQIQACHDYLAALEADSATRSPGDFAYLVAESRTSAARGTLDWLHTYRRRL
jgi:PadR family transcriptional regulator AphA